MRLEVPRLGSQGLRGARDGRREGDQRPESDQRRRWWSRWPPPQSIFLFPKSLQQNSEHEVAGQDYTSKMNPHKTSNARRPRRDLLRHADKTRRLMGSKDLPKVGRTRQTRTVAAAAWLA